MGLPGNFTGEHIAHVNRIGAFNAGVTHGGGQRIVCQVAQAAAPMFARGCLSNSDN